MWSFRRVDAFDIGFWKGGLRFLMCFFFFHGTVLRFLMWAFSQWHVTAALPLADRLG